jgi:hypothetical protein
METYKVIFDENETEGTYAISLVEDPAMESQFIALKAQEPLQLKTIDEEKRILLGAVLIPDKPVYRNQNGREFNIVFPKSTIRLSMESFMKKGYQRNSSLEHNEELKLKDVAIVESWIKEDDVNDKSVFYGFDEPIGTWFVAMKIDNPEVWSDYVKTKKVKGFSIDGFYSLESINLKSNKMNVESIVQAIKDGFASLSLKKEDEPITLGSVKTADETVNIQFEGEQLTKGSRVWLIAEDGSEMPLPDGDYVLENGMTLTVTGGIAETMNEAALAEETAPVEMEEAKTVAEQVVKSEKISKEIFYALAKEFGKQLQEVETRLSAKIDEKLEKEAVSLTKTKPAKDKPYEELTNYEKLKRNRGEL